MTEPLGYLLAHAYQLASSQEVATTDDRGGPTARAVAAGWYRTLLAPTSGTAGTATDPSELLTAVTAALGATKWLVSLTAEGRVRFTYLGASTGTLDFTAATVLRSLLGLTSSTIGPLATNATADAPYLPTHCVFGLACDPDSGWVDDAGRFAGARLPDGVVYGWDDGRVSFTRRATWRLLPKDWAARTDLGASGTPAFGLASRRRSPATGEPGQVPPWGALDTLATAAARQCGVVWGNLQDVIAGTAAAFELVYLTPEARNAGSKVAISIPSYDARRDVAFELSYAGEAER